MLCCIQDIDYNIIIYEWIENCVNIICSRKILKFLLKLHCSQKPQKRRWFCVIVEQFHMNGNLYSQLAWLRSSLSRKLQPHVNILHLPKTFQPASFQNKFNLRLSKQKTPRTNRLYYRDTHYKNQIGTLILEIKFCYKLVL